MNNQWTDEDENRLKHLNEETKHHACSSFVLEILILYQRKCSHLENRFDPGIGLTLSQGQAIALRNFLSEHAYPTMHEQPEIAAIFDELQSKVGV